MTNVNTFNPKIFFWARETAGYTREEAVKKLPLGDTYGKSALERLVEIETGISSPSNTLIRNMAKQYHRPEAVFYLNNIPKGKDLGVDYRTFEADTSKVEQGLADAVVRNIAVRQNIVKATIIENNECKHLTFVGSASKADSMLTIANSIREKSNFFLEDFRKPNRPQDAFSYLRGLTEKLGVFVVLVDNLGSHNTTINPKVFRGFSIADNQVPFIAINCNDTSSAWSFTLLHELTHIWIGSTGLCNTSVDHKVEKLCDEVASEILLPNSEFDQIKWENYKTPEEQISEISNYASKCNVSITMIAFRLLKERVITQEQFSSISNIVASSVSKSKANREKSTGGSSYFKIKAHRTGTPLIEFTDRMLEERQISLHSAGLLLGVRPCNVYKMLQENRYEENVLT